MRLDFRYKQWRFMALQVLEDKMWAITKDHLDDDKPQYLAEIISEAAQSICHGIPLPLPQLDEI